MHKRESLHRIMVRFCQHFSLKQKKPACKAGLNYLYYWCAHKESNLEPPD